MGQATEATKAATYDLSITRVFDAPRSLVFKVWSTPEHLLRWWGPKDAVMLSARMDFRPGGAWRTCFRFTDGHDYWAQGVYREVVEPERLVFSFAWEENGERGTEMLTTVTFEDDGGKTRLTFHQGPFETVENRDSHIGGWNECLDRLGAHLANI